VLECGPNIVADPEHLALLQQGVDVWNAWRAKEPSVRPDLSRSDLTGKNLAEARLDGADLQWANFSKATLAGASFVGADLHRTILSSANLNGAIFHGAGLVGANLTAAHLVGTEFIKADLNSASLTEGSLVGADLREATLIRADLNWALLLKADLSNANLTGAGLSGANLTKANLVGADLSRADLSGAVLVEANLTGADLTGCRVYGVSAWNVKLSKDTKQQDLVITDRGEPAVTVDNIEVAQFVYLLLRNEKIRDVIDTVARKGVLLLGRFTEGRMAILERLREELRKRGYVPIVFNFDKPETRDFTETVRLLAGLSKFVIADLSSPKSVPYELGAIVSQTMTPFQPIIAADERPFSMLQDLSINHPDRVFKTIHYSSVDALIGSLDERIIRPAEARFVELQRRKAETMGGEHV
jgi:uncharacterized protein YjbI with pentapeptide repeats